MRLVLPLLITESTIDRVLTLFKPGLRTSEIDISPQIFYTGNIIESYHETRNALC